MNLMNFNVDHFNNPNEVQEIHENARADLNNDVGLGNEPDLDVRTFIIRMIGRFHTNASVTEVLMTKILDECEELLFHVLKFLKRKMSQYLRDNQLSQLFRVEELLDILNIENPFNGLRTLDEQITSLKENCGYIEPQEIPLGYRTDRVLNRQTCAYEPAVVMETFQYVPIIKTLSLVMSNDNVREAILSEEKSSDENIISSFLDGQHSQTNAMFIRYPHALRLLLYYDETQIVNTLGPNAAIHKMGCGYFVIQNLPDHMNSELMTWMLRNMICGNIWSFHD